MRVTGLFLAWLLVSLCACSVENAGTVKSGGDEPWLTQAPLLFGCRLTDPPGRLEKRLLDIGYERQSLRLEAPYTRIVFTQTGSGADISRVELLVCNHPHVLAAISLHGGNSEHFSALMRERFQMGIPEWEVNDRFDFRKASFVKDFAGHTRAHLSTEGKEAFLSLEACDVMALCLRALADDEEVFRKAEQAEQEAAALRQKHDF